MKPTSLERKKCEDRHISSNNYGYAIFGNTSSSILYAYRLFHDGVNNNKINIISNGPNNTGMVDLGSLCFIPKHQKTMLHFLKCLKVHHVPSGNVECHDDDEYAHFSNHVSSYYTPNGFLADFISAYYLPEVGPWFRYSDHKMLGKFLEHYTTHKCLNSVETIVVNSLAQKLNLKKTECPLTDTFSIMTKHHYFLQSCEGDLKRLLFQDKFNFISHKNNINLFCNVKCIKFRRPTSQEDGTYNIDADGISETLEDVKPIWMTNHFTKYMIEGEGGLKMKERKVPVLYRIVYPIPKINARTNIDITELPLRKDLVSTSITFSAGDLNHPECCEPCWHAQAYTTSEDLSSVNNCTRYESETHTLLILEAVNLHNKRSVRYNKCSGEIVVNYNDRTVERGWICQFAKLFSQLYLCYTGDDINPDSLIGEQAASVNNHFLEHYYITTRFHRESPMNTVLELGANLYGSEYYPATNDCLC